MGKVNAREYRDQLDADIVERIAYVREHFSHLDEDQLNWKSEVDHWTIGQCFDHLVLANTKYLSAMDAAIELARTRRQQEAQWYRSGFMGRLLIRALRPGSNMYAPVPKVLEPSTEHVSKDVVTRLIEVLEDVRNTLRGSEGIDLAKAAFPSPFARLIKIRVGDAFKIIEVHDWRHFLQSDKIAAASGFPGAKTKAPEPVEVRP
jgi:hypothetical protein